MQDPLVLGVDSSTGSTKVEVRRAVDGALVASGAAPHPPTTPPRSEQDPDAWWAALRDALAVARPSLDPTGVVAMAIAGQQHGLVALGADDRPVRPAKLWNDTESAPQAAALVEALGARAWAERAGSVPTAAFTATKLAWLREVEPAAYEATRHVLLPHDELTARCTGERTTDRGDASGTGWWSPAGDGWDAGLLAACAPDRSPGELLAAVLGPGDAAGTLRAAAAAELGLPAGLAVAAGTGDNMAAALGLGLAPGDLVVSLGTSGTAYAVAEAPTADATGAVAGFADATGRFLPLVCTLNATKVTATIARLLGVDLGALDALACSLPSGGGRLGLLPHLDGERTPDRPTATGWLSGLRTDTEPAELALAAVEGVVCGLLDGVDALRAAGVPTTRRLLLIGGGARSAAYRRAVADLAGREVTVPPDAEHVALGACVQAAALALEADPTELRARWDLGHPTTVTPSHHDVAEVAAGVRARHRALLDASA